MRRTRLAPLVGAALLLLACSSDAATSGTATRSLSAEQPGATTTIVIGPDGSSTVVSDTAQTAPSSSDSHSELAGGGAAPVDPTGPPGSFAPALLTRAGSSAIEVDVRAQSSAAPRRESIDHVVSVLGDVSGKAVETSQGAGIDGGARSWSADELRSLVTSTGSADPATIHLLFVHGTLGGDNGILGASIRGDTAAIFIDRVNAAATPLIGSAGIEVAVVTHEVGHLLGLVDLYLHTGRQDPDHPGHSTNKNSVMYWAVESDLVANLLQGGPPRDFDSADLADLATIRNGG